MNIFSICCLGLLLAAVPAAAQEGSPEPHEGRIVLLNYWASWCAPCRKELPLLAAVHRDYASRGVELVGVSIDEPEDCQAAERLARCSGVGYRLRFDGTTAEMVRHRLGDAVPATLVLDRDGTPAFRLIGEVRDEDLRDRLEWLLGPRTGPRPGELVLPPGITAEHFREHLPRLAGGVHCLLVAVEALPTDAGGDAHLREPDRRRAARLADRGRAHQALDHRVGGAGHRCHLPGQSRQRNKSTVRPQGVYNARRSKGETL